MVINPAEVDKDGNYEICHFAGYWQEPDNNTATRLREELRTDEQFGFGDIVDSFLFHHATEEVLKYYNNIVEADGMLDENFPGKI